VKPPSDYLREVNRHVTGLGGVLRSAGRG